MTTQTTDNRNCSLLHLYENEERKLQKIGILYYKYHDQHPGDSYYHDHGCSHHHYQEHGINLDHIHGHYRDHDQHNCHAQNFSR